MPRIIRRGLVLLLIFALSAPVVAQAELVLGNTLVRGSIVTATVVNPLQVTQYVLVTARYHDGKTIHTGQAQVLLKAGQSVSVPIELQTITDDITPQGINISDSPEPFELAFADTWSDAVLW